MNPLLSDPEFLQWEDELVTDEVWYRSTYRYEDCTYMVARPGPSLLVMTPPTAYHHHGYTTCSTLMIMLKDLKVADTGPDRTPNNMVFDKSAYELMDAIGDPIL